MPDKLPINVTEGSSTSVLEILKTMGANGLPAPLFETDHDRIAYVSRLPVHALAEVPETAVAQGTGESSIDVTMRVTMDVSEEVSKLVRLVRGEMARPALQAKLDLRKAEHFRLASLAPAIAAGLPEMPVPSSPRILRQRYRLTAKGLQWLKQRAAGGQP
jgi:ATP-dependent DNA helicase RecG